MHRRNTNTNGRCTNVTPLKSAIAFLAFSAILMPIHAGFAAADRVDRQRIVRLATTTSTDNSGLLGHLLPVFEGKTGYRVHVIAVGTGKALRMGRDGDADVLLVHAPAAEIAFVQAGYGVERHAVMYNDFVLVGPPGNTKEVKISKDIHEALQQIAEHRLTFISRGDNSGTHKKELGLWKTVAVEPKGRWYSEVGQGMGKVLQMAAELNAYTLTDRGTWLAYRAKLEIELLFENDPPLFNPYGIIAVNPKRHPDANHAGAIRLIEWITSPEVQKLIGAFRIKGQQLFIPNANSTS